MVISVRLDDDDMKILNALNEKINDQWKEIFLIDDATTKSQTIRAAIRYAYYHLVEKESNKSNSS